MESETNVILVLVIGIAITFLFSIGVILFIIIYQNRFHKLKREEDDKLLRSIMEAERNERAKIARYLHDDVCSQLSAMKNYMGVLSRKEKDPEQAARIEQLNKMVTDVYTQTRDLSYQTMSPLLESHGLIPALKQYLRTAQSSDTRIDIDSNGELHLETGKKYELYRIIQELSHNMLKHGAARHIIIYFDVGEQDVIVLIQNDGSHFDIHHQFKRLRGMGLSNIFLRLQQIGGTISQGDIEEGNRYYIKLKK